MARSVQAAAGQTNIQLPNGQTVNGAGTLKPDGSTRGSGDVVTLTNEQYSQIPSSYFPAYLVDLGASSTVGDNVVTQAADVADPVALTSAQAGAAPTQAQFNALQADVVNIRATVLALTQALRGTGKAMA